MDDTYEIAIEKNKLSRRWKAVLYVNGQLYMEFDLFHDAPCLLEGNLPKDNKDEWNWRDRRRSKHMRSALEYLERYVERCKQEKEIDNSWVTMFYKEL